MLLRSGTFWTVQGETSKEKSREVGAASSHSRIPVVIANVYRSGRSQSGSALSTAENSKGVR